MNILKTIFGLYLVIDGTLLSTFGHRYLRLMNFEAAPPTYNRFIEWQIDKPEWLMRTVGAAMSSLGFMLLRSRSE